jgi:hypothetical protein
MYIGYRGVYTLGTSLGYKLVALRIRVVLLSTCNGVLHMSKKSKRQAEVSTESPVLVSDVPATEVVAETPAEVVSTETVASPEISAAPVSKFKYPREGGKCWLIWKHCDTVLESNGKAPTVKEVREYAMHPNQVEAGWNVSNASQEFYRWKNFRGLPK